ncbi:unnamed protein product [marine sediment metagenome]|uniref:Uncharacterized protein n=1 Tax=marine sediment metagenome TaxID=412755 RepID=X0Y0F8_9ZZZZ
MNKYSVELHGTVDYDMMPRVKGVKLLCHGYIEDYEIEIDLDVTKIIRIQRQNRNE